MSKANSPTVQCVYNTQMRNVTKSAFGNDYLDTDNHECQHIRDLFKDWDRQIYSKLHNQDVAREGTSMEIANHIYRYDQNLQKHIKDAKNNGFDITKHRKPGEFMYK